MEAGQRKEATKTARMRQQAALYWHSIRYTRFRQLLARCALLGKRKAMVRVGRWLSPRAGGPRPLAQDEFPLAANLPRPLFAPRCSLFVEGAGQPYLCLLNRRFPLTIPYNWHDPALEHGTRLEKLNLHYMEYLEAVDDRLFSQLIEDWVAQDRPYRPGYWRDCWNSYAISIRVVIWMQQYAQRAARLSERVRAILLASLVEQIRFLCRNLETDIRGNHLIKNIKALLWAGRFFTGEEARRWRRLGQRLLAQELREQILADGMHYERSPAYHNAVFADLLECLLVLGPGADRDLLLATLDRMAQVLADMTHPDGRISLFADGGLHMTYPPEECLEKYSSLTGKRVGASPAISCPDAGYFGLRQDDCFFLASYGRIGPDYLPAHAHGDIFSFEWDVRGQRWIVDAGVYEYHPGQWRDYARSTAAHNTVTIDDQDQCEFWSAFRVGRRAQVRLLDSSWDSGVLVLDGEHNGYSRLSGRPRHRRRIRTGADFLEVTDWVEGGRGQAVRARLLCHPECQVHHDGEQTYLVRGRTRINLITDGPVWVGRAWWSPDFGRLIETRQIVMDYGVSPCKGGFSLRLQGAVLSEPVKALQPGRAPIV